MSALNKASVSALIKLTIFIVVTTLATGVLIVTIGNLTFGSKRSYGAIFTDATGLNSGDDVRIAGVRVGTVDGISIVNRNEAKVSFSIDSDIHLTQATHADIRYRNLVGQRYVALYQQGGTADASALLSGGATIPISKTNPALDLTVLFNGFKPLFAALSPADVNKLAYEIIQTLQGEGGTVDTLLARTASITQTLANRDKLVGDVINNLNDVLTTVGSRDKQLSDTITTLQQFATGLKGDRQAILGSLNSVSDLAVQTASLVSQARPGVTEDVRQLKSLAQRLDRNKKQIDDALQILPIKLDKIGHTAAYGSFFNFYLCNFKGQFEVPVDLTKLGIPKYIPINYNVNSARCSLP
ncbi:MAG: MCE family protein [Nocardioidaceae bacterium]